VSTTKAAPGLSIFFPAYNDAGTIASLAIVAHMTARGLTDDYEVIVVDDGSPDHTGELLDEMARQFPWLKVVHHAQNRGYGGALRTGFETASKELVFYTDGGRAVRPARARGAVARLLARGRLRERLQDLEERPAAPGRGWTRLPLVREAAVRPAPARRRLRLPPAAQERVREGASHALVRR
jgi:hypothetical protein